MSRAAPAAALALAACLEPSPHALPDGEALNLRALEALAARPPPSPLRFAVVGDVQRHSDDALDAVRSLNAREGLAFVVQLGDFTDYGLSFEYDVMNRAFGELRVPYLVLVGNHDVLGNGEEMFRHVFGPFDLAFTHGGVRFVLLDTNAFERHRSPPPPDLAWLAAQLAPDSVHGRAVVFAHAGPDASEFPAALRGEYWRLLREGRAAASIHGHAHHFHVRDEDGISVVTADHVKERSYVVLTQRPDGGFDHERVSF
jgi:3',5'-cyclic AMP phosphodiesterase CpdA